MMFETLIQWGRVDRDIEPLVFIGWEFRDRHFGPDLWLGVGRWRLSFAFPPWHGLVARDEWRWPDDRTLLSCHLRVGCLSLTRWYGRWLGHCD